MNCTTLLLDRPAAASPRSIACSGWSTETYAGLHAQVGRVGNLFLRSGCRPGDGVLVALRDSVPFVTACLAAMKIGAAPVVVGAAANSEDFEQYFSENQIRVVVAEAAAAAACASLAAEARVPIIEAGPEANSVWCRHLAAESSNLRNRAVSLSHRAFVQYTSGSTGIRKGVVHTHRGVIAACKNVGRTLFRIGTGDRVLCTPRLSYSFGFGFGMLLPLSGGASTTLSSERWDVDTFLEALERWRPTVVCAVPSFLAVLLRSSRADDLDLSSLRYIVSAGEPLPPWIFDECRDRHGVEVLDGLGATELMSHVLSNRPGKGRAATCGVPVPGVSVKLLDDGATEVQAGEPGSLWVKAPTAFTRYAGAASGVGCARRGAWIATGDVLTRSPEGSYTYLGRKDDMCKVDGLWVSPVEVTQKLRGCAGVRDVFVTARDDSWGKRRLVAYVVPQPDAQLRETDVIGHCADWEPHTIPAVITVMSSLPLLPNGKVDRRAIPDPAWRGRSLPPKDAAHIA